MQRREVKGANIWGERRLDANHQDANDGRLNLLIVYKAAKRNNGSLAACIKFCTCFALLVRLWLESQKVHQRTETWLMLNHLFGEFEEPVVPNLDLH